MRVGIAYDLKSEVTQRAGASAAGAPDDTFEEYDSQATIDAIAAALRANGHEPVPLGGGRTLLERLLAGPPPDLVFNIAEGWGSRSREAHVPSVLELLGIPYTHSDPLTCAVTLEKAVAKRIVASAGVTTPAFAVVSSTEDLARVDLPYPVIAKPLWEGSSKGVRRASRATDQASLEAQCARLLGDYGGEPVLVESFCPGPEFTVGILGTGRAARAIGVMEVVPKRDKPEEFVYSIEVKRNWEEEVEYHVPPKRPASVTEAVAKTALDAYRALDCRDVGRVDVRLDAAGRAHFLEVNPLPGINPITGDLCILARGSGLSYDALVGAIVASARERWGI